MCYTECRNLPHRGDRPSEKLKQTAGFVFAKKVSESCNSSARIATDLIQK